MSFTFLHALVTGLLKHCIYSEQWGGAGGQGFFCIFATAYLLLILAIIIVTYK